MSADIPDRSSWWKVLGEWTAITFGVLLGGGVALHALEALRHPGSTDFSKWCEFWWPLLLFSLGGGLTVGLLILTWWFVVGKGFSWTLGFLVLAVVLFALFVWPTRYAYYWTEKKDALIRVERLTGKTEQVPIKP
jgi:membrane protein YdbS with pleckstrin-like domain